MDAPPLRIAVLGTPRSGNSWLRMIVGAATEIPTTAVHELTDSVLAGLPRDCVVQIHWRREPEFLKLLADHGFRVLTIARHPLDVLISILQFAIHDSESDRWLLGRAGDESGLFGAMPGSRAFAEYGTGERARELFGVTADWWADLATVRVKYEDLVADPLGELLRLRNAFRPESNADLSEIIARHELAQLRKDSFNNHFWKGQPGHWRRLLTGEIAGEIAAAHAEHFRTLGYGCDADPTLTDADADRNWIEAAGPSLRAALRRAAASHVLERDGLRSERDRLASELAASRHDASMAHRAAASARLEAAEERARFEPFEGLQGFSVRVARAVQTVRDRVPKPFRRPPQPR